MRVIPAVNETAFEAVREKIERARDFGAEWVHIDVSDGIFTQNTLWNNPEELGESGLAEMMQVEVHLMIKNPEQVIDRWLVAGVKRVVIHVEAAHDIAKIERACIQAGVELVIAANPETDASALAQCPVAKKNFLVLAVRPGVAGQVFIENQLDKIKNLRQLVPDATIEVDGGVTLENAPQIKIAGADIIIAASAMWSSENPGAVYQNLTLL